jgi:hypothetical protein
MKIPKQEFKDYKREYEYVFTSERIVTKGFELEKLSTLDNKPNLNDYKRQLLILERKFWKDTFNNLVKIKWLMNRFVYDGNHRTNRKAGFWYSRALSKYMKYVVGIDNRMPFKGFVNAAIVDFLEDLFPDFHNRSPFEDPEYYRFPYKNLYPHWMAIVRRVDERLELLDCLNKKKLTYPEYLDYLLNWCLCYNDEFGYKYELKSSGGGMDAEIIRLDGELTTLEKKNGTSAKLYGKRGGKPGHYKQKRLDELEEKK